MHLTLKKFDLLVQFAGHPGRVYTRTQLLDAVWGYGYDGLAHTVNSHINRLRSKLERVLENLLDNDMQHTPAGGTVTLSLMPAPGGVTVAVTETGAGIPPHELTHILERYYRASRTGQAREKPAGRSASGCSSCTAAGSRSSARWVSVRP